MVSHLLWGQGQVSVKKATRSWKVCHFITAGYAMCYISIVLFGSVFHATCRTYSLKGRREVKTGCHGAWPSMWYQKEREKVGGGVRTDHPVVWLKHKHSICRKLFVISRVATTFWHLLAFVQLSSIDRIAAAQVLRTLQAQKPSSLWHERIVHNHASWMFIRGYCLSNALLTPLHYKGVKCFKGAVFL